MCVCTLETATSSLVVSHWARTIGGSRPQCERNAADNASVLRRCKRHSFDRQDPSGARGDFSAPHSFLLYARPPWSLLRAERSRSCIRLQWSENYTVLHFMGSFWRPKRSDVRCPIDFRILTRLSRWHAVRLGLAAIPLLHGIVIQTSFKGPNIMVSELNVYIEGNTEHRFPYRQFPPKLSSPNFFWALKDPPLPSCLTTHQI